jgi:ribosome maturation factor RimP
MIQNGEIKKVVEELAEERGFFIVEIQNKKGKIKVIIDDQPGIKLDECIDINKALRAHFGERIDEYDLEVTSPGLTEPFKVLQQYRKNIGQKVQVLRKDGTTLSGTLLDVTPEQITLEEKKRVRNEKKKKKTIREEHAIALEDVQHTKLLISF